MLASFCKTMKELGSVNLVEMKCLMINYYDSKSILKIKIEGLVSFISANAIQILPEHLSVHSVEEIFLSSM
jgi:hypothetical protein